ncbi:Hypothetical predicted protein [Lecanosticta acicola]|uniref:C3H1-type domain-containing protein n=1 Tax=Lecanosticta acicola TaxID=111012 RepID=A0AAI8Z6W6_9PEZI|nr:Hypothetical predicted protein [Lecanosticta acicola]
MEGSHMKITPQKPAHEVPCGLELCPLKEDSAKARQAQSRSSDSSTYDDAVRASQSAGNDSSAQQSISAGATKKSKKRNHKNKIKTAQEPVLVEEGRRNSTTGPINTNITYQLELSNTDRKGDKKRKCAYRHPDQPVKRRRTDLDYDDDISNGANIVKDRTCFFWYHGWCPKESDAARGLGPPCDYRHSLTDRPTMVQYPPRDHHGGIACGKQWCPIGRDATSEHQYTSSLAGHQARESSSEPSTPGEGKGEGEGEGSGNPDSDTTCFFWYHGSCARSKDPRNGHRCGFLHALTDPPTMVQPPPGYKHRTHCERDWCPGDARERFTTLKDAPTVGEQQSPEDAAGQGKAARDEAQQPDWFLKGFDW